MLRLRPTLALVVTALSLLPLRSIAQAPSDVPQGHWAYEAVQDLASKGLLKGYPPSGNFFGGRTVTRYEMASLVQRALARVDELLAQKADKGASGTPAAGVTQDQLDEVKKLVEDFRVELTVMGTNLQKVQDELGALKGDVANIKATADQAAADAAAAKGATDDVKQGLGGAIDAIHEQASRIDKLNSSKVDAGFGKIKVNGLAQVWIQSFTNSNTNPSVGLVDTFRLRRMELSLSGNVNPKAYWKVLIDPAKTLSINTTSSGGNLTGASVNNAGLILQDAFVGVQLNPLLAVEVGQQKVPLSMEGMRSSAQLLTVERSIFNVLPTNNGRVGDIRDLGGMLRLTHPMVDAQLAVFDDAGNRQNNTDDNNAKEIMYHAQFKGFRNTLLGVYQEISGGVNGTARTLRNRLGLEAAYTLGKHRLEAEAIQARDGDPRVASHGGYLLYAYKLNPTWEFVGRGEYWNPNRDLHGAAQTHEYDLTAGINYYLTDYHAKIQLNWIRKNINGPMAANGSGPSALTALGPDRNVILVNFQQAF